MVQTLPFLSGNDAVRANENYVTNQQMRMSKYVLSHIAMKHVKELMLI